MVELIHFSDLHVWRGTGVDGDPTFKRFLGWVNLWAQRARRFPREWGRRAVEEIARRDADAVIFSGDASTAALIDEFKMARQAVAPIREKWGTRFIAIPGNHDRYTSRSMRQRLFERQFLETETSYPFCVQLADGVGLVAIDVSGPRILTSRGFLSRRKIDSVAQLVEGQRRKTPCVIVVGHYPLAFPPHIPSLWHHALPHRKELARALERAGASLYLHGHKHVRWIVRPDFAPGLLCVNAGSAGTKSSDPARAAGFVRIRLESNDVTEITAVNLRRGAGGLQTETTAMLTP